MESITKYLTLVGKEVDGRYTVRDIIGIGGMAVVLKAYDNVMQRDVALKILNDELKSDDAAVRRFVNESKAVAMLSEPHIVSIYDVAFNDNLQYIAMEYVDGVTLKAYMADKLPLSVSEALHFTEQILLALEHAHEKGVVHRDIKPQNILLLDGENIKVADFGIAQLPTGENIEQEKEVIGTINYISPEQVSAQPTDFHTDLYSLGIMLYEMVTGRLPFIADNPKEVARMQREELPPAPSTFNASIPPALDQLILKSIQKKPEDRFRSAHSVLRAIQTVRNNPDAIFDAAAPYAAAEENNNPQEQIQLGPIREEILPENEPETRVVMKTVYKRPRRSAFPIIVGVFSSFMLIAAILILRFFMYYFNFTSNAVSETMTVPDLVGQIYNAALKESLRDERVNIRAADIEYDYNSNQPINTILSQSPAAGSQKKIGGNQFYDVKLVISGGHKAIQLPDYSITAAKDAKKALESLKLSYKEVAEYSDTVIAGYVIRTVPEAGSYLNENEQVVVYVSKGQSLNYTAMPDLVGRTLNEAKNQLQKEEIVLGSVIRQPSSHPSNTVISQSIAAGYEVVKKYTVVDIVVSIYMPNYSDDIQSNVPKGSS